MKICPKCQNSHEKQGLYCSRKCANSRVFTEKSKEKKRIAAKRFYDLFPDKLKAIRILSNAEEAREKRKETFKNKRINTPFEEMGFKCKKATVVEEQEFKCNKCKLDKWFDHPIVLELEHKDGNRQNNIRDNLEALCPNCHSLTETWRGRNTVFKKNISDEDFYQAILSENSIHKACIKLGIAPKGGNYKRAKKIIQNYIDS